jgi:nicotinamidase-related amidase
MMTIPGPVILDLNTQRDFLTPEGLCAVFQSEKLHEPLRKLFSFAYKMRIPIVSTRLHHQLMPDPQRGPAKIVCNPNTAGYSKMPFTQLRRRQEWPLDCGTDLPTEGFRIAHQYIFDLPSLNLFECPRLDRLLSEWTVESFVILGAPLEWTVRTAVLGLLQRRHKVAVVSDCLGMWDPYDGDMALRQIESKNVEWFTTEQFIERYRVVPKSRVSRLLRAKARSSQPNTSGATLPSKPRGVFRI